jgi:hypothetical protein
LTTDVGYDKFFEWFYTEMGYFEWLVHILGNAPGVNLEVARYFLLADVSKHAWAIMSLVSEISFNNEQRITFPLTSVDGLKLFRSTASALISFGNLLKLHQAVYSSPCVTIYVN